MTTLGLDLGTNSIGWAIVRSNEEQGFGKIDACGVRIFQEAVEDKTRVPKNQKRRQKRGMRKILARRRMRRDLLMRLLSSGGLLPNEPLESERLFSDDSRSPYLLRAKGLDEPLTLQEFGRVLFHLSRRRGFKSNRKAKLASLASEPEVATLLEADDALKTAPKKDDEEGQIKKEIGELRAEMALAGARTLGEFLWKVLDSGGKVRGRHTDRSMYEDEFEILWAKQALHHEVLRNPAFKAEIHNAIFHQRPLKVQRFLVDPCRFEPSRKRAAKALCLSHEVRIWQEINNLRYRLPGSREEVTPTLDARKLLDSALEEQLSMTWGGVRKQLGLPKNAVINLESENRDKLLGNITNVRLAKAIPDTWPNLGDKAKRDLLTDLLTIDRADAQYRRFRNHWKLSPEEAYALATLELEPGVASLSERAMKRILPFLKEGFSFHDACQKAGYEHDYEKEDEPQDFLPEPPNTRNPVVQKALFETRRVVNAIVRKYGKPDMVRIEMARDMKMNKLDKEKFLKQQNENRKLNEQATEFLVKNGIAKPSREDKLKYRLWRECGEVCPYTGKPITPEALFHSGDVDIEHIIPWSVSLDDSYMNKSLCFADENRLKKRNRTPFEAYAGEPERFAQILHRVEELPGMPRRKKRLFNTEKLPDDFAARQLSDTRYICKAVKDYIKTLYGKEPGAEVRVDVTRGGTTAVLRHRWGLNSVLHEGPSEEEAVKTRDDHRHHAIDAIVVALTTRSLFKRLQDLSAKYGGSLDLRGFDMPEPWPGVRRSVEEAVAPIIISHAATRRITGALHEDTVYGPTREQGKYVVRKKLDGTITANQIAAIRDPHIRKLVQSRLDACDGDPKRAFGDPSTPLFAVNKEGKVITNRHGEPRPIDSVRILVPLSDEAVFSVKDEAGKPYKVFIYGSNHHVEIIENVATGKREGRFITTREAAKRARIDRKSIVDRTAPEGWKFVMSLAPNDLFEAELDGSRDFFRVQYLASTNNKVVFRQHLASSLEDNSKRLMKTPNSLKGHKVVVTPLGEVLPCRD